MGKITGVSWADSTWNPWIGCRKISPGCGNCYMFREQERYGSDPNFVHATSVHTFNTPLRMKEPKRIFACSWSDFFIEEADLWRDEAWDIIRKTPQHKYQLLTKRPENILDRLPDDWNYGWDNVMLLVTGENQILMESRMSILDEIPTKHTGLSIEPILGEIDFIDPLVLYPDWVIAGGESGAKDKVRMDNLDWYRYLRDQCQEAGIPFFLKQAWIDGKLVKEPFLDGRQWLEFPDSF
jgi:protein gp37